MNAKKPIIVISATILLMIVVLPIVFAQSMTDPFASLKTLLYSAMGVLLDIFKLGFLKNSSDYVAFMRFMVWIISFAVFNAAAGAIFAKGSSGQAKGAERLPMVIALVLASITAVFMPESVLFAIGIQYSAIWSVIILGAVFAGLLWICFKGIKGDSTGVHLIRVAIILLCWILIFNFTDVIEKAAPGTSATTTNLNFVNPILDNFWYFINAGVGILLIYEIFKLIGSIGKSTVGNLGGNMTNLGGWVDKTRDGWGDLTGSLGKRGTNNPGEQRAEQEAKQEAQAAGDVERQAEQAVGDASARARQESNANDRAIHFGRTVLQQLTVIATELKRIGEELKAGNIKDRKTLVDDLKKITGAFTRISGTENAEMSSAEWLYSGANKELDDIMKMKQLGAVEEKIVNDLKGKIYTIPDTDTRKGAIVKAFNQLNSDIGAYYTTLRPLEDSCRQKNQLAYMALNDIRRQHDELTKLVNATKQIGDSTGTEILQKIDAVVKSVTDLITKVNQDVELFSTSYIHTRDEKGQRLSNIQTQLFNIRRDCRNLADRLNYKPKGIK